MSKYKYYLIFREFAGSNAINYTCTNYLHNKITFSAFYVKNVEFENQFNNNAALMSQLPNIEDT